MVTAKKSSPLVRGLWLAASLLITVGGVALKVNHQRVDFSAYLSEITDLAIRAMYVCIVISGLCGMLGALCGRTWRASVFGLAAPMAPVLCGAVFALLLSVMHRFSSPSYFEQMTSNERVAFTVRVVDAPEPIRPGPQRFNGSP